MGWSEDVRKSAARFYQQYSFSTAKAGAALLEHLHGVSSSSPGQLSKRWCFRMEQQQEAKDKPRTGPQESPRTRRSGG
jgi:hypothetical protein